MNRKSARYSRYASEGVCIWRVESDRAPGNILLCCEKWAIAIYKTLWINTPRPVSLPGVINGLLVASASNSSNRLTRTPYPVPVPAYSAFYLPAIFPSGLNNRRFVS